VLVRAAVVVAVTDGKGWSKSRDVKK